MAQKGAALRYLCVCVCDFFFGFQKGRVSFSFPFQRMAALPRSHRKVLATDWASFYKSATRCREC